MTVEKLEGTCYGKGRKTILFFPLGTLGVRVIVQKDGLVRQLMDVSWQRVIKFEQKLIKRGWKAVGT